MRISYLLKMSVGKKQPEREWSIYARLLLFHFNWGFQVSLHVVLKITGGHHAFFFISVSSHSRLMAFKKMFSGLRVAAILGLVLASSISSDARRRSRLDFPIQVAADAPLEDNVATASDSEVVVKKIALPQVSLAKEQPKEETTKQAAVVTEESTQQVECNSDNINFELVTG
jgi:hypothetical protein